MSDMRIEHQHGDRFLARIRDHSFLIDQPVEMGGDDLGPTPTELFVAGLASCVGFYAERYLRRHEISDEGLAVECDFVMSEDRPARVASIALTVVLPAGFPPERAAAFRRVIEHCTVHNSIVRAPEIDLVLVPVVPIAGVRGR